MNKFFIVALFCFGISVFSQFKVNILSPADFSDKEMIIYTINGSKSILETKVNKSKNGWSYDFPNQYEGMLKIYFPESNSSFNIISENKDINANAVLYNGKFSYLEFSDQPNQLFSSLYNMQSKKEQILPALYQIKEFYKPNEDFYQSLDKEIARLSSDENIDASKNPFVEYFFKNYNRFLVESANKKSVTRDDIVQFINSTNQYLETSNLMRPILIDYLNISEEGVTPEQAVNKLLDKLDVETPRGQVVLSELIDIFDVYGMNDLKDKYLTEATNLKCTINDRLASTIEKNKKIEIGAVFSNYSLSNPINTTAKTIYDIKSDKKVIVFWSSECSHCERELPVLLENYDIFKKNGIEIIGFSLDTDKARYISKTKAFPWVNSSELKGWNSGFAEVYNINATPTYFILDKDNKIIGKPMHVNDVLSFFKIK